MLDRLRALLRELRRRKVGQMAAAYGATALATALAVSELYDDVGLPDGSPRVVILLLLAGFPVALAFAWFYEVRPEPEVDGDDSRGAVPPSDAGHDDRPSIVVLPFDNISADESDAYLSDGLTEEITADLSYVRALRVISRSSATALKASGQSVTEMTQRMRVEYVLEGSVRKVGDHLRVTAQLIRA
ncbi:MAG: hypothetical protein R3253_05595, partial [Longimicrobiales bacterium]|nr:hypothetical protein [Longimicrobiales bacterium]